MLGCLYPCVSVPQLPNRVGRNLVLGSYTKKFLGNIHFVPEAQIILHEIPVKGQLYQKLEYMFPFFFWFNLELCCLIDILKMFLKVNYILYHTVLMTPFTVMQDRVFPYVIM
jgi:hypothetical protein